MARIASRSLTSSRPRISWSVDIAVSPLLWVAFGRRDRTDQTVDELLPRLRAAGVEMDDGLEQQEARGRRRGRSARATSVSSVGVDAAVGLRLLDELGEDGARLFDEALELRLATSGSRRAATNASSSSAPSARSRRGSRSSRGGSRRCAGCRWRDPRTGARRTARRARRWCAPRWPPGSRSALPVNRP